MYFRMDYDSYPVLIAVVVIIYELLITADGEINLVWRRKFSIASCLMVSIRWNLLFGVSVFMIPLTSEKGVGLHLQALCLTRLRLVASCSLIMSIQAALFAALLALGCSNYHMFFLTLVLGLVPFAVDCYMLSSMVLSVGYVGQPHVICGASRIVSARTALIYTLACRIPVIIAQTIVVVLTWNKTYRQYALNMRSASRISVCLFHNGNVYFAFLVLLNILKCMVPIWPKLAQYTVYLEILPPIFVNRFLVDLRRAALHSAGADTYGIVLYTHTSITLPDLVDIDMVTDNSSRAL